MKLLSKSFLKKIFSFLGFYITRTDSGIFVSKHNVVEYKFSPLEEEKYKWLQNMDINTVIDVGAHLGEFALQIHELLPNAKLYCFEPLPDNFIELKANLKDLSNFQAFNLAVGDQKGKVEMYRNDYSPSSSLMKMTKLHKDSFPFTSGEKLEKVEASTLDEIVKELELKDNVLLKIDVQGYEARVIRGAKNFLDHVNVIIIETSFYELYEGQLLFADIYELLSKQGFVYSGTWEQLRSPIDGTPLQQDSIFIKK